MAGNLAAGNAAHLTGTVTSFPSIFEVISAQSFSTAVYSALRHVIQFVASRDPERLGFLLRHFDELHLLLDTVLEWQYFKTKRATLGEAFYGLQRYSNDETSLFSTWSSLLAVVLIPYIRRKLSSCHSTAKDELAPTPSQKWLLKIYPVATAVLSAAMLYKYVRFALGISASHDYVFDVLGIHLGHAEPDRTNRDYTGKPLKRILVAIADAVLWSIEIGSFFAQFLETYNQKHRPGTSSMQTPPFYKGPIQLDDTKCPLCQEVRKNPAALSTSGFSFCYMCVSKFVKQNSKCPVTNIPSRMDHIIRIFYS